MSLIKELIEIKDREDRESFFNDNFDNWDNNSLLEIADKLLIANAADLFVNVINHPNCTIESLEYFGCLGKFPSGAMKSVLMNKNCSEDIILQMYKKSSEDKIFNTAKSEMINDYGDDAWELYSSSVIDSINSLAEKHPNFPKDLQ